MIKLMKPCPFCGSNPRIYTFDHGDGVPAWNIECRHCALDMGHFESIEELINVWNTRHHVSGKEENDGKSNEV